MPKLTTKKTDLEFVVYDTDTGEEIERHFKALDAVRQLEELNAEANYDHYAVRTEY